MTLEDLYDNKPWIREFEKRRVKRLEALKDKRLVHSLDELDDSWNRIVGEARQARLNAYAPYSEYAVGACVLGEQDYYAGCNVEHALFTLTTHAEEQAINSMIVGEGPEAEIRRVGVVVPYREDATTVFPCGLCRAKISEHAAGETPVLSAFPKGDFVMIAELSELYPYRLGSQFFKNYEKGWGN